jgi:integrase
MASLQKMPSKRKAVGGRGAKPDYLWRKQMTLLDGRRVTVRLGAMSTKAAEEISNHIDHLLACKRHNTQLSEATKAWLQSADEKIVDKLHSYGLCGRVHNPTIQKFVADFMERKKASTTAGTYFLCKQVEKQLNDYFPTDTRVSDVTVADAKQHWHWMITKAGIGENTAKRRLGRVREIFTDAVEQGVITSNPFILRSLPVSVGVGVKRYVSAETIEAIIAHLTADKLEWKLLFAFGRYVGCRMPSEIRELKLTDVNWSQNTILLQSPKTACKGKPDRLVPIFKELNELLLQQCSKVVEDGGEYVFPELRKHTNTATTAAKMVRAAGFESWPKFWNSLRASRETDLMDSHGLRLACAWIGNTPAVAIKHYALMRKSDYIDAGRKSDAKSDAAPPRIGTHSSEPNTKTPEKTGVLVGGTTPHGFEP